MADNSWWKNSTEGNKNHQLTAKTLDEFIKNWPDPQPHYNYVHPDHEKHKLKVRLIMGLKKTPTKKSCPLCKRSQNSKREE